VTTIYILWLRQLKRYVRSKPRIVASLGQPLLFLLVWVSGWGRSSRRRGRVTIFSSSRPEWSE